MVLAPGMASAATGVSVLNLAIPGPVGGSQTCLNGNCVNLRGVADVQVSASARLTTLGCHWSRWAGPRGVPPW